MKYHALCAWIFIPCFRFSAAPCICMRAAGLFRVSDFRLPRAFVCARVSSFCVSGCTAFCKRWVFRSARRGLIPCFLLAACPFLLFARIRGALCFADGRLFPRSASDVVRSPRRGRGNAAPLIRHFVAPFFPPRGGKDMEQTPCNSGTRARRSVCLQGREHGHGAPYVCKGENAGTALRMFAKGKSTGAVCRICAHAR